MGSGNKYNNLQVSFCFKYRLQIKNNVSTKSKIELIYILN
jgi:hypothetical protein